MYGQNFVSVSPVRAVSYRLKRDRDYVFKITGSSLARSVKKRAGSGLEISQEKVQKVRGNILSGYPAFGFRRHFSIPAAADDLPNEDRPKKLHRMSARTATKIREKTMLFCEVFGPTSCTFLTLTFIGPVSDHDGQKCLNKFLTVCRQRYKVTDQGPSLEYLWVAERQTKSTNNIHFHVLVNKSLPITEINGLWIRQQMRQGVLCSAVSPGVDLLALPDADLHGYLNPVDISRIRNSSDAAGYVTKYITKASRDTEVEGFGCCVWNCSRFVSQMATGSAINAGDYRDILNSKSNYYVSKHGELVEAKSKNHYDRDNRIVAITLPVFNFAWVAKKYLREVVKINRLLHELHREGRLCRDDFQKRFRCDKFEYFTEYQYKRLI